MHKYHKNPRKKIQAIWRSFDPPPDPPKIHHLYKIEKNEVFQNVSHDTSIDAKFDADFKNV